jgi:hypothetical protein
MIESDPGNGKGERFQLETARILDTGIVEDEIIAAGGLLSVFIDLFRGGVRPVAVVSLSRPIFLDVSVQMGAITGKTDA